KSINKKITCIYWPVLTQEEGYWISPLSSPKALKRVFEEILHIPVPVMLDLELPYRKPSRWFTGLPNFLPNKALIHHFIKSATKQIYTYEHAVHTASNILGISYNLPTKKIFMYYTSQLRARHAKWFIDELIIQHLKDQKNLLIGLGCIATGILGTEKILSPQNLEKDLEEMKKLGIGEVVIFRLAGLNTNYLRVLKKYMSSG
ncbi:MAG: hypothetical protein QF915_05810, partial [Candidatus Woesearchaeota archaeon]|nr:hypothetical protein [Candidatus Woesearchaeota archaeon]